MVEVGTTVIVPEVDATRISGRLTVTNVVDNDTAPRLF